MDSKDQVGPTFWQPEDEWTRVVGQHIEIHEKGHMIDRGRVEDVTRDGNVLWLAMEGAKHRRLVEKYPGRDVKILPGTCHHQDDRDQQRLAPVPSEDQSTFGHHRDCQCPGSPVRSQ